MFETESRITQDGESRRIQSKYEFVMAAAKEAERLNDHYRKAGTPTEKVTIEAVKRVRKHLSRVIYEEPANQADEPVKESTYFFGN